MIGSAGLTRYSDETFITWDTETHAHSLNLFRALPWELSWSLGTLKGGVTESHTRLIKWPNVWFTPDNPSARDFNREVYDREAVDPRVVWEEFGPLLKKHRSVFQNGIGYDSYIARNWAREVGSPYDFNWLIEPGCFDTNALAKAYFKQFSLDSSSRAAFLRSQYQCLSYREKGLKTKLGVLCKEFGVEYDEKRAHGAAFDTAVTFSVFREMVKKMEV